MHQFCSGPESMFLRSLPVVRNKNDILSSFRDNTTQIIVLKSGTGSGKSLGLVYMMLEDAFNLRKSCLSLIAEPRRFAVMKATETLKKFYSNGPLDGIGYHMRNESNYTENSNCIFLTSGVLFQVLKSLLVTDNCCITHIIIDEAHDLENNTNLCLRLVPIIW